MTAEYAKLVAGDAYSWAWPHNRRLAFPKVPQRFYSGAALSGHDAPLSAEYAAARKSSRVRTEGSSPLRVGKTA